MIDARADHRVFVQTLKKRVGFGAFICCEGREEALVSPLKGKNVEKSSSDFAGSRVVGKGRLPFFTKKRLKKRRFHSLRGRDRRAYSNHETSIDTTEKQRNIFFGPMREKTGKNCLAGEVIGEASTEADAGQPEGKRLSWHKMHVQRPFSGAAS